MFVLTTQRLLLRDLLETDWQIIYALSQELLVTQYQTWLQLTSTTDAQQWVQKAIHHNQLRPRSAYNLAIVTQQPEQVLGWIGWGQAQISTPYSYSFGYALLPQTWGQGYMTEALDAALKYMCHTLYAETIYGECVSSNVASARVMEKVGMQRVYERQEQSTETARVEQHWRYQIDCLTHVN